MFRLNRCLCLLRLLRTRSISLARIKQLFSKQDFTSADSYSIRLLAFYIDALFLLHLYDGYYDQTQVICCNNNNNNNSNTNNKIIIEEILLNND